MSGGETQRAFHELLDLLRGIDAKFASLAQEADVLDGYRWIPTLLQVALDAHVWAEPANPLFVDIVGPTKKWGGDNADAFYQYAPIDPARTYRVTGQKGDAAYLSLTVYGGPRDGRYSDRIVSSRNDRQLRIAPDGSFELWLSPEPREGDWLALEPDAVCAVTRDYLVDPERGRRASWRIEAVPRAPTPPLDDAELARRFRAAATFLRDQLAFQPLPLPEGNQVQPPYPVPPVTRGWAAGDAAYAMGSFDLADDQALLVRGRSPACAFWNVCLWNPFLHTYDYRSAQVTLNGGQVRCEPDGSWILAVAPRDPRRPNWLSTAGRRRGLLWFRWFLPAETPQPLETEVIELS